MKYDQDLMNKMADNFENYLEIIQNYVIIEGLSEDEYNKHVKRIKKLIKKLRKGKGNEVYDKKRYIEMINEGKTDI